MKKLKKFVAIFCLITVAILSLNMGVIASENETTYAENLAAAAGYTVVKNMIDYTVYDADMVYIQEHADKVAEYNKNMSTRAYSAWNWTTNGVYSRTTGSAAGFTISYYFTPVNNYLYFNVDITGGNNPYLTVNKLNSDSSLSYIGSYNITSTGGGNYNWSNKKRSLTSGQNYVFSLWNDSGNWSYSSIDIYKSSI